MQEETKQLKVVKTNPFFLLRLLFVVALFCSPTLSQHYAYVTNNGEFGDAANDDLSIVDLATNTVVATVAVGDYPQGAAINPAGTAVYVANTVSNAFTVIDTATYTATTIPGPGGVGASGAAVHPDGTRIYITNPDWLTGGVSSTVWVLDRATNTIIDEISCGQGSCGVAVHPEGTVAYVTNAFDGTIAVFDTDTHEVIDTIVLETVHPDEINFPVPITVHPEGTYVYAANRQGPTFWAINTATHDSVALPFGHTHVGIGVNPEGTAVYLPDFHDEDPCLPPQGTTLDVIDTETLDLITTIDGLNAPVDVSVHPDGTRLYITNFGNDTVSVIDAATNAPITSIPVGKQPNGYGYFIGPGVPRLLKEDAVARLEAVKETIENCQDGVVNRDRAMKHIETAVICGKLCVYRFMWSATDSQEADPRRLNIFLSDIFFWLEEIMVESVFDTIRCGWILDRELRSELLAAVDEAVRADRVLAAVVIDDAILAGAVPEDIQEVQEMLEEGDSLVKEAAVWQRLDRKASLLDGAIKQYRNAWEAALDLTE